MTLHTCACTPNTNDDIILSPRHRIRFVYLLVVLFKGMSTLSVLPYILFPVFVWQRQTGWLRRRMLLQFSHVLCFLLCVLKNIYNMNLKKISHVCLNVTIKSREIKKKKKKNRKKERKPFNKITAYTQLAVVQIYTNTSRRPISIDYCCI